MGHVRVYTIADVISRWMRLRGVSVLHPIGFDAFGLPADNAARERQLPPTEWTQRNIVTMTHSLRALGCAYDWRRSINTSAPEYYRHTQSLFLDLYHGGLAYRSAAVVNFDPIDQTVLANEQVDADGRSWRSGAIVERRLLTQWFIRITQYADALLDGLNSLPQWPEHVKSMQRQWIGRSQGALVKFALSKTPAHSVDVFTTRIETLFGVCFVVVSREHSLLKTEAIGADFRAAVDEFCQSHQASVRGVFSGATVVHPLSAQ